MASKSFIDLDGLTHYDEKLNEKISTEYVNLTGAQTITGAKTFSSDITLSSKQINNASCVEFKPASASANNGGYLDFHFNQSNSDWTSRIIESASGTLSINNVTITTGKVVTATTFTGALSGNASTATKLATTRSISAGNLDFKGSANFDGSGNIALNVVADNAVANVNNKNNYPYHRFAYTSLITGNYVDYSLMLLVNRPYYNGGYGICYVTLRTNNASGGSTATLNVQWLARTSDLPVDSIQAGFTNTAQATYADLFYKSSGAYATAFVRVLGHSNTRYSSPGSHGFTLVSSNEVSNTTTTDPLTSTECYATIAAAGTALREQDYTSTVTAVDAGVTGGTSGTVTLDNGVSGILPVVNGGTGSSTQNFVDLTTNQSIGGTKTFTAAPVLNQVGLSMTVKDTNAATLRTSQVLYANSPNGQYGINIAFCSGGNCVVGGGEAGTAQLNALAGNSNENLYLVADGTIYLKPNGNTWANAKVLTVNTAGSITYENAGITRGTNPSANVERGLIWFDSAGNKLGVISNAYNTDSSSETAMWAYKTTAATGNNIGRLGIGSDASGNVYTVAPTPAVADSSTKIATTAWCRTATGNFACNAATATKATQDGSGNVITTTYATKSELNDITSVTTAQIDTLF